jgi:hypothetical protein
MFNKIIGAASVVCLMGLSVFAQNNARVQSLGGAALIPDINQVMALNPVYMNDYKNQMQATFNTPILGIFGIGNMVSVGAVLSKGLMLDPSFYAAADGALNLITPPVGSTTAIQYVPHLLFGLDFSTFQIGLDAYVEHCGYSTKTVNSGTLNSETTNDQSITNAGAIAGFRMKLSSVNLALSMGAGMPTIYGKNNNGAIVNEIKSDKSVAVHSALDVGITAGNVLVMFGAKYNYLNYRFLVMTLLGDEFAVQNVMPFIGIKATVADNVLLVVSEQSSMKFLNTKTTNNGPINDIDTLAHIISGGLEKQFANIGILDSVGLRGGLSWTYQMSGTHSKTVVGTQTTEVNTGYLSKLGPAVPYLGFGASKGFFNLDISVNPAVWAGVFVGPPVTTCTATFKF